MNKTVSLYEAKSQLSTLLREVEAGAAITITRHGKPVAELRTVAEKPRPKAGSLKSPNFYMADDFDAPLPEFAEYTHTAEQEAAFKAAQRPPSDPAKSGSR